MHFSMALVWSETETDSTRIWTRVIEPISSDDYRSAKRAPYIFIYVVELIDIRYNIFSFYEDYKFPSTYMHC